MQFIFDWTNISYHITHVRRLMHKWNLKPKVPQKVWRKDKVHELNNFKKLETS